MKTSQRLVSSSSGPSPFSRVRRVFGLLLCTVSIALVCSAAITTQVETPEISVIYHAGQAAQVTMYDDTPGAIVFYTKVSGYGGCTTPMHNMANPIPPTKKFVPNFPVLVGLNNVMSFKAVGYKAGLTDSLFTTCVVVDNTNQ